RSDTLRGYATVAGFGAVDVLALAHPFIRFSRLLG
ncbi:MAG: hypothetical protein K0R44_3311, partial [Thermomicrobiales bacterium]|nr:hypothetical protein [Thermomicrobiales bacterium]